MAGSEYDGLDPLLIAAIEDMFAALDPTSFLDGPDPQASVKAYEQMVTGDWDGDIL
ncbi:hypothetical protein [Streptomyces sp. NPDC056191]|uniref:hypothetical protein n=1 Tax=Streptomyces sp. NPDC056191 TaxID=3345742 RepID=UPI0035DA5656